MHPQPPPGPWPAVIGIGTHSTAAASVQAFLHAGIPDGASLLIYGVEAGVAGEAFAAKIALRTALPVVMLSERPAEFLSGHIHLCPNGGRVVVERGTLRLEAIPVPEAFPLDSFFREMSGIFRDNLLQSSCQTATVMGWPVLPM